MCRLITVPENKTFLCTVYFTLLQKCCFYVKFYLPEMPFTVSIWYMGKEKLFPLNGQYGKCKRGKISFGNLVDLLCLSIWSNIDFLFLWFCIYVCNEEENIWEKIGSHPDSSFLQMLLRNAEEKEKEMVC